MWSRREVLAALASSGASLALGTWGTACSTPHRQRTASPSTELGETRLAQVYADLSARVEGAYLWSKHTTSRRVSKDSSEAHFDVQAGQCLVLGSALRTLVLWNPGPEQLLQSVAAFGNGHLPPTRLPEARVLAAGRSTTATAPTSLPVSVEQNFSRALQHISSRIIYVDSFLVQEQTQTRLLSKQHNLTMGQVRTHCGVRFAAWTGDSITSAVVEKAAVAGVDSATLSEQALQEGVQRLLSQVHARSAPEGIQEVIFDPACAALIALHAIAKPAFAGRPQVEPTSVLRVHDDPSEAQGFGGYLRDDLGNPGHARSLFGKAPRQEGSMRRDDEGVLRPLPSNVVIAAQPGQTQTSLVQQVSKGVLLQAPSQVSVAADGTSLALICQRGKEIADGRFTGRVFSTMLTTAACAPLFAETQALSEAQESTVIRDRGVPMSVRSGHWLTRAKVSAA